LTVHFQWSPWLTLPVAICLTIVVALLVALPMLKLHGFYLGMGTLGFGMIGFILFRQWTYYTGGDSGLVGIPALSVGTISLESGRANFFMVWSVVVLCFFVCRRLVNSRIGRALKAVHDSERTAAAMGIDTAGLKVRIFVLSAVFAAVAGFLYAHMVSFISPDSFGFLTSVRIVTMVVIGGMATIWGALLGATLITLLPEWLHVFIEFEMVVYGLVLMVIMIFLPQGLTRGLLDIYERSKSRKKEPSASPGS
jgi:branched-chain amino acid transport system permease protein